MIGAEKETMNQILGAVVAVLDDQDRLLILLRPHLALWSPLKWGLPGGKLEEGEAAIAAAIRETKEETQLDVTNLQPLGLKVDIPVRAYYTRDYTGDVRIDYEHDDWTWVPRSEIESYPLAPQVLQMFDWVLKNE